MVYELLRSLCVYIMRVKSTMNTCFFIAFPFENSYYLFLDRVRCGA